jgi:hypothetical protein
MNIMHTRGSLLIYFGAGIEHSVKRLTMGWKAEGSEFEPRLGQDFLLSMSSRPVLGPSQRPIQCVPEALSPGIKQQGRHGDHSPPTSTEVKYTWIYISTPPYAFMA